ncbi:MAG: hypothetical protein M1276_05320 [Deltaproteobacteria bacterium]|jgi:hypothetical protein|nr:hypothetical protein [Deltaproteobacteria bacterium]
MNNPENIFKELKDYIDEINNAALNSGKKDDASSYISYIGMILDEISNSFKKGKPVDIDKISEDLDSRLKSYIEALGSFKSETNMPDIPEKLDALSLYCNKVFMELMAGDSCAIPESFKN